MRTLTKFGRSTLKCTSGLQRRTPARNVGNFWHNKRRCKHSLQDSVACISVGVSQLSCSKRRKSASPRDRRPLRVEALVTFDYAQPALWLGAALISGGVFLLNLRNVQPVSSKDSDIVLSCILVFSGGILIFQGWRLDPLLLFVQICTTGTAFTWALESINLRKDINRGKGWDDREKFLPEDSRRRDRVSPSEDARFRLPPPEDSNYGQWYGNAEPGAEFEDQPSVSGRGFYQGRGQEVYYQPAQGYYDEPRVQEGEFAEQRRGRGDQGWDYQQESPGPSYYQEEADLRYPQDYRDAQSYQSSADPYYDGGVWDQRPLEQSRGGEGFGEEQAGPAGSGSSSRVVDDVENYYKRPESVVEDVERFYDSQGRPIYPPDERRTQATTEEQYWASLGPQVDNPSQSQSPERDPRQGNSGGATGFSNGDRDTRGPG